MVPVIYSDEFLEHKTGRFHPEARALERDNAPSKQLTLPSRLNGDRLLP
jgi:hypothetical protein